MSFVASHAFRGTRSFFHPTASKLSISGSRKKSRQNSMRKETRISVKQNMNQLQPNSVNTVTEGAMASVPISGVSVLKGLCQLESMRVSRARMETDGNLKKSGPTFSS